MPELSKRTFDEANRFETVVFQEGTHPADFEMVELQDIQNNERQRFIENLITDGALGEGFLVVASGLDNAVNITLGAIYTQGQRLILPDGLHQAIGAPPQFIYNMPVGVPTAPRTDLIYLTVSIADVTATQYPNIEDPTLGPGAYREQVQYSINIAQSVNVNNPLAPAVPTGSWTFPLATVNRYTAQTAINASDVIDGPVQELLPKQPHYRVSDRGPVHQRPGGPKQHTDVWADRRRIREPVRGPGRARDLRQRVPDNDGQSLRHANGP
jgi:hypothetical protein